VTLVGERVSTRARALDFLAFSYGILFLVSAGNIGDEIPIPDFVDGAAFEAAAPPDRAKAAFRGLDALKADRRVLSPGDSVNALTIGSWHRDSSSEIFRGGSKYHARATSRKVTLPAAPCTHPFLTVTVAGSACSNEAPILTIRLASALQASPKPVHWRGRRRECTPTA
jgi:hypothetical protein